MPIDPGSKWWPLPEAGEPDGHRKTQFIVHSTGDNASADRIRGYFAQIGVVVESTFIVGMTSDDPTLQVMHSTDVADANTSASVRAISVEVVGDGTGPFTDWQVSEIIRLGIWAAANHPIEKRICPAHDQSGFGWHVMFGAPGPWTEVKGKICPGPHRITQLRNIIFPAIFAGTYVGDDDLSAEDVKQITGWTTAVRDQLSGWIRDEIRTQVVARLAAQSELLLQLVKAKGEPLDPKVVEAAVEKGVAKAVKSIDTVVTFEADQPEQD